jgi:hypothetical protein
LIGRNLGTSVLILGRRPAVLGPNSLDHRRRGRLIWR